MRKKYIIKKTFSEKGKNCFLIKNIDDFFEEIYKGNILGLIFKYKIYNVYLFKFKFRIVGWDKIPDEALKLYDIVEFLACNSTNKVNIKEIQRSKGLAFPQGDGCRYSDGMDFIYSFFVYGTTIRGSFSLDGPFLSYIYKDGYGGENTIVWKIKDLNYVKSLKRKNK